MTMNQKPNSHKLFQTIYFSCHFLCSWWSHLWCLEDSINSQPSSCFGDTRWNNSSIASRDIGRKVCERRQVIRRSLENSWPMDPMKLERPQWYRVADLASPISVVSSGTWWLSNLLWHVKTRSLDSFLALDANFLSNIIQQYPTHLYQRILLGFFGNQNWICSYCTFLILYLRSPEPAKPTVACWLKRKIGICFFRMKLPAVLWWYPYQHLLSPPGPQKTYPCFDVQVHLSNLPPLSNHTFLSMWHVGCFPFRNWWERIRWFGKKFTCFHHPFLQNKAALPQLEPIKPLISTLGKMPS